MNGDNHMPDLQETVTDRQVVYPGMILQLEHWQVRLADGSPAQREVACLVGASAIAALDQDNRIALVRQYRPAIGQLTWQLPAGKLDSPQEPPLTCAKRELLEQTGITAAHWEPLMNLATTPGFCSERIHIYLATDLHSGVSRPDEGEFLHAVMMPLDEAVRLVRTGEICDGKTVAGILMVADRRRL